MLEKKVPYEFRHIHKLSRDTFPVSTPEGTTVIETQLQCAVSQQQHNGINKFFVGSKCGCILSEQAMQMVGGEEKLDSIEEEKDDAGAKKVKS